MMNITATRRQSTGSAASRRARRDGRTVATVYGSESEALSVELDAREVEHALRQLGYNGVFELAVEGEPEPIQVMFGVVSRDPIRSTILNLELRALVAGQTVRVSVPVILEGADNVTDGVVLATLQSVDIEAEPMNIPNAFVVDVSAFAIGDTRNVSDLELPEGVTLLTDPDETIVSVVAPTVEEEETTEDEVEFEGVVAPEGEASEAGEPAEEDAEA